MAMPSVAQPLFVGSYNIRYHNTDDDIEGNVWAVRSKVLCDLLNFEAPDVFGTQEVLDGQLHDMLGLLDGYAYIGVGRDDGKREGEYAAIFYKTERISLLRSGHFWLSETPDKPSLGWDAACVRLCTWGEFELREQGSRFFFFNVHMDHVGVVARREGARLVMERIREITHGAPVVLTGDFNVDQSDEIYALFTHSGLLGDTYVLSKHRLAENGTFNDFDLERKTESRIDHVFVSPDFEVERYGVLTTVYWTERSAGKMNAQEVGVPEKKDTNRYMPRTPSDHYPVMVKLKFK